MRLLLTLQLIPALTVAAAWDLSFLTDAVHAAQQTLGLLPVKPEPTRIAIIGAGAGGSSAAFWIRQAVERHGTDVEVHIFDKNDYVGGRTTTVYPYNDTDLTPIELGASIFVRANKNLLRAVEQFGLTLVDLDEEMDDDLGAWDGQMFRLMLSGGGWWDSIKVVWRYGYQAPQKTKAIVTTLIDSLMHTYTPSIPYWSSIEELSRKVGFERFTSKTGLEFFTAHGVNPLFAKELIDLATRVNYAQNVDEIHGLDTAVSMAADGAFKVAGGNWQIFSEFVKRSGAEVFLNSTITGLTKSTEPGKTQWTLSGLPGAMSAVPYDQVILAAPFHLSGITLNGSVASFPPVEYIHLHVTVFTTNRKRPLSEWFGLKPDSWLPGNIYTTAEGVRNGGPDPGFQSLCYYGEFDRDGEPEHLFKMFSLEGKPDEWLEDVFGPGSLRWVLRKEWDAYPKAVPTTSFPSVKADDGLWYVNSMEPFISTMETETLSSRNVVDNLLQETFGYGICPNTTVSELWESTLDSSRIYGWDC